MTETMTTKQQLQTKIIELEEQLSSFKQQLNNYKEITIETAKVGDVLEDGCIVVDKQGSMALLAAPSSTEVRCKWSKEFGGVFEALKDQGFNPTQWFIPTKEQLKLAYDNCKKHFASRGNYWSSTEAYPRSFAYSLFFGERYILSLSAKYNREGARAFRVVNF